MLVIDELDIVFIFLFKLFVHLLLNCEHFSVCLRLVDEQQSIDNLMLAHRFKEALLMGLKHGRPYATLKVSIFTFLVHKNLVFLCGEGWVYYLFIYLLIYAEVIKWRT